MRNLSRLVSTAIVSVVILSLLIPLGTARAWEQPTHSHINFEAVKLFMRTFASSNMKKYELGRLDARGWNEPLRGIAVESRSLLIDPWTGAGLVFDGYKIGERTMEMSQWIAYGGDWADEPHLYASVRHFYDPFAMWGASYLTDHYEFHGWYDDPQIDARTWALNHRDNPFSFESALSYYKAAMETPEEDLATGPRLSSGHWKLDVDLSPRDAADQRSIHLAMAYRALGESMHLLGDMTQPAHVRNDSHPINEPIEQAVKSDDVIAAAANPVVDAHVAQHLASAGGTLQPPEKLFDEVARFTNQYFYSADTIYDYEGLVVPANIDYVEYVAGTKQPYPSPQFKDLLVEENTVKGWLINRTVKRLYAPLINDRIPLAQEKLSSYWFRTVGDQMDQTLRPYHVPPTFADEQARVLMPVAIHACADLMHHFYPTLELKADYQELGGMEGGRGDTSGHKRTVIEIGAEMIHHVAEDVAWQEYDLSIAYDGPAKLVFARGDDVLKTRDLHFLDGRLHKIQNYEGQMVEEPLRVYLAERGGSLPEAEAFYQAEKRSGDTIYLEIQAGTRTFRSEPYAFDDEEIVAVSIQPPRHLVLELAAGATEVQHNFEAVASPDGAYRFDWDFGDGKTFSEQKGDGASSQVSHTYTGLKDGDEFYPTVKLYTRNGGYLAEDSVRIVVTVDESSLTFTPTPATTASGNWVLQEIIPYQEVFRDSDSYPSHSFTIGDGSYSSSESWTDAPSGRTDPPHGSITFSGTWSPPPSYLKVGEDVTLAASIQGTASTVGDGYKNKTGEVAVWYTGDPPPNCLPCRTYGTTDIVRAGAGGSTTDYPVSTTDEGSFTVPEGQPGDVLVIVAQCIQPGGRGQIVYKYVYDGPELPPERDVAPGADVAPADDDMPTPEAAPSATARPASPPTPTTEPTVAPPDRSEGEDGPPAEPPAGQVALEILNHAAVNIERLHIVESNSEGGWGQNWLGSGIIRTGDSHRLTLAAGVYDLVTVDEDGVFVESLLDTEIQRDMTWAVTGVLEPPGNGMLNRQVRAVFGRDYDYDTSRLINPARTFQSVSVLYVAWSYRGFPTGTEYEYTWYRDGEMLGTYHNTLGRGAGEASDFYAADAGAQSLLTPGKYEYWVRIDGQSVVYGSCMVE